MFDEDGDPAPGASISIIPVNQKNAGPVSGGYTNDRGEYRAWNISPGKYRIAVTYAPPYEQTRIHMKAAAGAYASTFYPAAVDQALAQVVNVEAGADLSGFDVQISRTRAVTVKGTVTATSGPIPPFLLVNLYPVPQAVSSRPLSWSSQDGRGIFEIGHVLPEGRKMPSGMIVDLEPQDRAYNRGGGIIEARSDGSFQLTVPPGDYDIGAEHDDLYVSDIRAGDQDALSGIHVGAQPVRPLKIILKGNGGTVLANVKETDGKPRPNCYVQLMPDPPRRKQRAFYSYSRTDATGTCTMPGIAPGAYRIFAGLSLRHPDELADTEDSGTAFTIAEGEKRRVEVKSISEDKPI